jgi:hypothetical protein
MPKIIVKSKGASFRRAGMAFTREGVEVEFTELPKDQWEAIFLEPNLTIFDPEDKLSEREQIERLEQGRAEFLRRRAEECNTQFDRASDKDAALIGSDELPATIVIGDNTAQAGDIVAMAFTLSGSTVEQWNSPGSGDERERLIQECLANLQADPSIFQAYLDSRAAGAVEAKQAKPAKAAKGKAAK